MADKVLRFPGLGERIKEAMAHAGLDVTTIDREFKIPRANLYEWTGDRATPSYGYLMRLCAALKVAPAWLLFGATADVVPELTPPAPAVREARERRPLRSGGKRKRA